MKHLLDFDDWNRGELKSILETSNMMEQVLERPIKKVPALQGFTICTAFFENSTRTKVSFELAARRMSADVVSFASGASSLSKGESLRDTLETLKAMRMDCFIVRHPASGAAHQVAKFSNSPTVNAGDGRRAHPTQALLDAYTLKKHFGKLEGLKVAIIGDVRHSRVARSNAQLLKILGADVTLCGPAPLLPRELSGMARLTTDPLEAVKGAHAVMALRIQQERLSSGFLSSLYEYRAGYQVNEKLLKGAREDAIVMHPGPMLRDLEISGTLASSGRSVILEQVENGVAVRMAVLYHLLVGKK